MREEIAVARKLLLRPFDLVDEALDHPDADHRALRRQLLRRHHRARQHVTVRAVLGGDALREIVDRLQRNPAADHVGIEQLELLAGVDGRACDLDPANDERGGGGARRRHGAGQRDRGAARLRTRRTRLGKLLPLPARLCARRKNLCGGDVRNTDHRRDRQNATQAGQHASQPPNTYANTCGAFSWKAAARRGNRRLL